jgi:murein DD-endopeptidase MepM/ murein hydrolase activator NlpD
MHGRAGVASVVDVADDVYDATVTFRRSRAWGALLLLAAAALPANAATGAEAPSPERMRELRSAIGEASAEEAAALRELADIRARTQQLDGAVADFDRQIRDLEARLGRLQEEVDRLTARAATLEEQANVARVQLDLAKQRTADAAAAMYRGEDGVDVYADVLDVDNVYDVFVGSKYLTHISALRRAEVHSLAGLEQQIESLQQEAAAQRDRATAAQEQARRERDQIVDLRAQQQQKRDAIAQEEQREHALIESIRARKDRFAAELVVLQAASNAISQMLAARQSRSTRANGFLIERPVPGAITGGFGMRVHPILGNTRMHTGVDMHASACQPIRAAAAGIVAFAGVRGGYGNTVIIDHGNQFATLYGHASALRVSTGQSVQAGEVVALAGSTGLATGPHLHFEVRILGNPVNPVSYL